MMLNVLALLAVAGPTTALPYTERMEVGEKNEMFILREAWLPDRRGGSELVEVRLKPLNGDEYEVDFDRQPEATKAFHEALCAVNGMVASGGRTKIGGPDAVAGWSCSERRGGNDAIE